MNKVFIGITVLVLGALVGWYVLRQSDTSSPLFPSGPTQQNQGTSAESTIPAGTTGFEEQPVGVQGMEKGGVPTVTVVSYTDNGFGPATMTVQSGTTVRFINEGSGNMWVASDLHPTHQLLPGFDQLTSVGNGGTYEFIFTRVGTWRFHNHVAPVHKGTVVVQ